MHARRLVVPEQLDAILAGLLRAVERTVRLADEIFAALSHADLFVSIGTSGAVYPAAGFVQQARSFGARALELNLERSQGSLWFDETRLGPASERVPQWVKEVLGD